MTLLAQGQPTSSPLTTLLPILLMVAVFYFLLIRPQQKRVRQQRELIGSLAVGDEVVTIGGIFGRILEMEDESITLDVGGGTRVRLLKQAVARRLVDETQEGEAGEAL